MKERPILFSGPMVRALREGRKMQTRRMVKPQPTVLPIINDTCLNCGWLSWVWREGGLVPPGLLECCPYGQPGDQLYVKEAHAFAEGECGTPLVVYRADGAAWERSDTGLMRQSDWRWDEKVNGRLKWRPSIHLHRKYSRLTLEVVSVRVERVQSITEADAIAEGVETHAQKYGLPEMKMHGTTPWYRYDGEPYAAMSAVESFRTLWKSINGDGSWEANPFVWVVSFKRIEANP